MVTMIEFAEYRSAGGTANYVEYKKLRESASAQQLLGTLVRASPAPAPVPAPAPRPAPAPASRPAPVPTITPEQRAEIDDFLADEDAMWEHEPGEVEELQKTIDRIDDAKEGIPQARRVPGRSGYENINYFINPPASFYKPNAIVRWQAEKLGKALGGLTQLCPRLVGKAVGGGTYRYIFTLIGVDYVTAAAYYKKMNEAGLYNVYNFTDPMSDEAKKTRALFTKISGVSLPINLTDEQIRKDNAR